MKIYYLRHTEADDDRRDSFGGISDDPLIDNGREYAKKVGNLLKDKGIEAIFTSPYLRAKETASLVNTPIKAKVFEIYELRERNSYGVLSGIEKPVAEKLFPKVYERVKQMKADGKKPSSSVESLPGAEIYLELLQRAESAFQQIEHLCKIAGYKTIAIVTHGGFTWALFKDVFKKPLELEKGEIVVLNFNKLDDIEILGDETTELKGNTL